MADGIKSKTVGIRDLLDLIPVTRRQLDQWISRKYFVPEESEIRGRERRFSYNDTAKFFVFSTLVLQGVPPADAKHKANYLKLFKGRDAFLVVWQGRADSIKRTAHIDERGNTTPSKAITHEGYTSFAGFSAFKHTNGLGSGIVDQMALLDLLSEDDVRCVTVINLNSVERRIDETFQQRATD
ncbi:MAG: hypothetical protein RIC87_08610 [Kiloniellales bacterium]